YRAPASDMPTQPCEMFRTPSAEGSSAVWTNSPLLLSRLAYLASNGSYQSGSPGLSPMLRGLNGSDLCMSMIGWIPLLDGQLGSPSVTGKVWASLPAT